MSQYIFVLTEQQEKEFAYAGVDFTKKVNEIIQSTISNAIQSRTFTFLQAVAFLEEPERLVALTAVSTMIEEKTPRRIIEPPPGDEIPPPEPPIEEVP